MNTLFKWEFTPTIANKGIYHEVVYYNFLKFRIQIESEQYPIASGSWRYSGTLSVLRDNTWHKVVDNVSIGALPIHTKEMKDAFADISDTFKEYIKAVYS